MYIQMTFSPVMKNWCVNYTTEYAFPVSKTHYIYYSKHKLKNINTEAQAGFRACIASLRIIVYLRHAPLANALLVTIARTFPGWRVPGPTA